MEFRVYVIMLVIVVFAFFLAPPLEGGHVLETKCGGGGYLVFRNQEAKRRERGRATMKKEREKQAVFL